MRRSTTIMLSLFALLSACGAPAQSPPAISLQPATVYTSSDGYGAWYILSNRFWSGAQGELDAVRLSEAPASVSHWRANNTACVSLDEATIFGAPDILRKGARFRCGTARFEVADCDFPEDCRNALILAFWRTGIAPDYHELPVNYFYNRCRGVQSITFSLDRPLRVVFGSTLELRQGLGLLAQPETPACRREPGAELYGR